MASQAEARKQLLEALMRLRIAARRFHTVDGLHQGAFGVLLSMEQITARQGKYMTMSQLGQWSHISKPQLTRMIRDLEDRGFVERTPGQSDRRTVYVSLTDAGRAAMEQGKAASCKTLSLIIDQLGQEDTRELIRLVNKLSDVIKAGGQDPGNLEQKEDNL